MRSITNIFLLNLAVADLLLSVICMPSTLLNNLCFCWTLGYLSCKLFAYLQPVSVAASAYTLAVIALERYNAICRPLKSRPWQTRSHAYKMIAFVWLIAFVSNIYLLFMYNLVFFIVYLTIVLLLIPLCMMVVLYGLVIHSLRASLKLDFGSVQRKSCSTLGLRLLKQRLIRMLVVIVILFFCCWTPNFIFWLIQSGADYFSFNPRLHMALLILCYLSSCTNPITYCFLNKKFRTALLITFGCRKAKPIYLPMIYMPNVSPQAVIILIFFIIDVPIHRIV
uniref:G_PROTEIN_RECEP_F1_2 domain-containing protein n=1 Tax=Syphacia muris TaxID=451379 RepID=A0A0N5A8P5_9BILA